MNTYIRREQPQDEYPIEKLTQSAFLSAPHSNRNEQFIVNALRRVGQLTISLIAEQDDEIQGHVAISPVTISSGDKGWYGLGPISVLPGHQKQGIGTQLMKAALHDLQALGALGCVVLGDPKYYERFGFKVNASLVLPNVPAEYFLVLPFKHDVPVGTVCYQEAFEAKE
ncbi:N-acetyltransferase [Dyadobacter sp. LHD-138]|uniref:GNAT family N-acetyltransferase n=1 Tax=Dyadobacter sp. LHD-138 TaxID=3071413 RepID=UPI0027E04885|nr:N-acetyltransferase [Dyadobacter sp. LHD-138]MDQ6480383.1 N-acetyltransferase [Dyadobacter sp. LHD-138]